MSRRPIGRWLFGKLPAKGDFVSRGLDFALRDALDEWLSAELSSARAQFGDAFEERYFAAPACCFVDCDPEGLWSGGAICASIDSAGRKFPVIAGAPADNADAAMTVAGGLLELLYVALAERREVEWVHASPIGGDTAQWSGDGPGWALASTSGPPVILPGRFPQGVFTRMLEVAS